MVLAGCAVLVPATASAAGLGVTSARLSATVHPSPPFHLTATSTISGGGGKSVGRPTSGDVLTVELSRLVAPGSVCPGATSTVPATWTGVTAELTGGGTGPNRLTVTGGPATCPTPRFPAFVLGSGGYTTSTIRFTSSSLLLTHEPSGSSTLSLTLGNPSGKGTKVTVATVITALPHLALRDLSGQAVSGGTTLSPSVVHF